MSQTNSMSQTTAQSQTEVTSGDALPVRPDGDWAAHAEAELQHSPYSLLRRVRCEYRDGVLTMRGCLPSYYLKQVAQTLVADALGGNVVIDNCVEVRRAG